MAFSVSWGPLIFNSMHCKKNILGAVCIGILSGILLAGLLPLDFRPVNNVRRMPAGRGLHFDGPDSRSPNKAGGMAFTPDLLTHPDSRVFQKGEITIELWLKPDIEPDSDVPRVAAFYDSDNEEKLIIGQWKTDVLAWVRQPQYRCSKPYRHIGASSAMHPAKENFVTVTSDKAGTSIYLDGKLIKFAKGFRLLGEKDTLAGYQVILGNSADIVRPWSGEILGFALFGYALSDEEALSSYRQWTQDSGLITNNSKSVVARYEFNAGYGRRIPNTAGLFNPLIVPDRLVFSRKPLAKPDFCRIHISDVTLNLVGFIPLGAVLALYLGSVSNWPRGRACLAAILAGGSISLFIEMVQTCLPTRHSSQMDLICNTLGTMVGAAVFYLIAKHGTYPSHFHAKGTESGPAR